LEREIAELRAENARLRRVEIELRKVQADLRALIENTDDFILFSDAQGLPVVFNSNYATAMKDLLGVDMKPGLQPHTLLDPEARAQWDELHKRVLEGERFKTVFPHEHAGETRHYEVSFNPVFDGERVVGFSEFTRDITDRMRLEEELRRESRRSRESYRELFDKMLDGVAMHEIVCDDEGRPVDYRFLDVNPAFERITGLRGDDVVGRCVREVMASIEDVWIERYGDVVLTGKPARFEDYSAALQKTFEVVAFQAAPGQFVTIFQDVTLRRRVEQERTKIQRLESLGTLAGGIAHDFNNLLASLLASIELARMEAEPGGPVDVMLKESEIACQRATALTQQLLDFARGGVLDKQVCELGDRLVHWAAFSLRGSRVEHRFEIAPDLWPVEVDEGQIGQVVQNLVINAAQAMPNGGAVTVRAQNLIVPEAEESLRGLLPSGPYVRVQVEDEGAGIPDEILLTIFDAYFSTKKTGSGLGLATSLSIVRSHAGLIRALENRASGACLEILLPAARCHSNEVAPSPEEAPRGCGRILVMDDDPQVRALTAEILERLGYDVESTLNAHDTVQAFQKALDGEGPFTAVILDLTIPGGEGGLETLAAIRALDATVPAVVSSGYALDPVLNDPNQFGFDDGVTKPYSSVDLARVLERAIGSRHGAA
jgi:PAS domain S-box-containing protein